MMYSQARLFWSTCFGQCVEGSYQASFWHLQFHGGNDSNKSLFFSF